jgi:SAM-dependent methyltransferase
MPEGWVWDETLYQGSARFYVRGRQPYAPGLAQRLVEALELDGSGRLIDVGCGPGVIANLLSPYFADVVGVDPDSEMLTEASRMAIERGLGNVQWVQALAEELPGDLGSFDVATFAQSFHWMERERVATQMLEVLVPGGAWVHVADAKTPRAGATDRELPFPPPPYDEIAALVRRYLGPVQRAGQGFLRHGPASGEAEILARVGYEGPEILRVPAEGSTSRSVDDLVAWTFSMSGSAPHLFGDRLPAFERELRSMLGKSSHDGKFSERPPDTEALIWRVPMKPVAELQDL